jgi:hypothetical protein
MRIYLSGPMSGYPEDNFPAFYKAAAELRAAGHEVYNPPEDTDKVLSDAGIPITLRACLSKDLSWICDHAEGIALMLGWERSKGANAENATAIALGLKRMFQDIEGKWVGIGQ